MASASASGGGPDLGSGSGGGPPVGLPPGLVARTVAVASFVRDSGLKLAWAEGARPSRTGPGRLRRWVFSALAMVLVAASLAFVFGHAFASDGGWPSRLSTVFSPTAPTTGAEAEPCHR